MFSYWKRSAPKPVVVQEPLKPELAVDYLRLVESAMTADAVGKMFAVANFMLSHGVRGPDMERLYYEVCPSYLQDDSPFPYLLEYPQWVEHRYQEITSKLFAIAHQAEQNQVQELLGSQLAHSYQSSLPY